MELEKRQMPTPDKIKRLVEIFDRNLEAYKSSGYKEANVRSEFIDPFFEALGWDVYNKQGYGLRPGLVGGLI